MAFGALESLSYISLVSRAAGQEFVKAVPSHARTLATPAAAGHRAHSGPGDTRRAPGVLTQYTR
eukprot:SAG31_NODE_27355_length_427_cov_0.929878_2_plen_63_part_01